MSHITHSSNSCNGVSKASWGLSSSSPADIRAFVTCCALFAISLCTLFAAPKALAATWPVSASALSASVSFHESYSAGNESYVHSGIDIPASAGMQISAPLAGTVRFTGVVPSGDSRIGGSASSKTMHAVTVEVQDGRAVTLMPFDAIQVSVGQVVDEGACLGTLAVSGDLSSPLTHLHMGYKVGRTYLDPMQLFGASSPLGQEHAGASSEAPSLSKSFRAPGAAPLNPPVAVQEGVLQGALSSDPVPSFGSIETGAYSLVHEPQLTASPWASIIDRTRPLISACEEQFSSLMRALSVAAQALSVPFPVLICGIAVLAIAGTSIGSVALLKKLDARERQTLQPKRCKELKQFG